MRSVIDGDTLALDGGGELRLVGIEAPKQALAPGRTGLAQLEADAGRALAAFARTGLIILRYDAMRRDRYGRILAHGFHSTGAWLQAAQVGAGLARVHGDGRNRLGLRALLTLEAAARTAGKGLWRHPAFAVLSATDPNLKDFAGSFQIVEGRVFTAEIAKDTGYVNFGADRHSDLTLVLKKPVLAHADAGMIDLAALAGKLIRCRGWLDLYDGPRFDVTHTEQIEVLEN